MATRAASAAPIQRVLRESGIQDPLPRANRNLNSLKTTLNSSYSGCKEALPVWPGSCNMFHLRPNRSQTPLHEEPDKLGRVRHLLARESDVERRASFDRRGTSAAEGFAWPGGQAAYRSP
jgi:hypothetical protein